MQILFATDGSEGALQAAPLLTDLPLEADCQLTLLTVNEGSDEFGARQALAATEQALSHVTASLSLAERHGHAAEEIVRLATELPADLIVVGSHGRRGLARFLLGSTCERVARHATCPVLVIRGDVRPIRRVLIGLDGSECSEDAVEWLRTFPWPLDAELRLVTVIPNLHSLAREHFVLMPPLVPQPVAFDIWQREQAQQHLRATAACFVRPDLKVVTNVRSGDPLPVLLEAAREEGADLIVVGSHGYGAFDRLLLGSVSENLLRHAPCSVLVVRQPARAAADVLVPVPA